MADNREFANRRTYRLQAHDYAEPGGYFITLVTHERQCLFGEIVDLSVRLTKLGEFVQEEWLRSAQIRPGIILDAYVVMPNHVHGIVILPQDRIVDHRPSKKEGQQRRYPRSLGSFVAGFKSATTARINTLRQSRGIPVWQRNYYDHVIRNDIDLGRIRDYIVDNPARWQEDFENPEIQDA